MSSRLALDGHKLLYHLDTVSKWEQGEQVYPLYLAVSMSEACNHKCLFCVYDYIDRTKTYIDKDSILRFMKELGENGLKAAYFSGEGEPLMHPDAIEIIRETKGTYGIDCALNSNGWYLTKDKSEELLPYLTYARFSVNGCSPENYKEVHRTSAKAYDRVLQNLEDAVAVRKDKGLDITLGAQCVILAENIDLIPNLAADLKRVGIDYLALKPFLPYDLAEYRTPLDLHAASTEDALRRAEAVSDENFKVVIRWESIRKITQRTYDKCLSHPFMLEVDSKGELYLCGPLLGQEGFGYGNINTHSYGEILQSDKYKKAIEKIGCVNVHNCMPNCRNDAVNRFLWDIRHPPQHVNFI